MRVLGLDPAENKFGVAGIEVGEGQKLSLYMNFLLESPPNFKTTQKSNYMSHCIAAIMYLDKPDFIVSEFPWGAGFSKSSMERLIGAIRAETWQNINWQGVSEARKAVLGDGYGGAKKRETAEWLLTYNWDLKSKRALETLFIKASPETDEGYDVLDAVLHILCFLIKEKGLTPVHKEQKVTKKKKKSAI